MERSDPHLIFRNANLEYGLREQGKYLKALDKVSFSVGRGEFVTIVGPSGCGKTSILNVVAGLLPLTSGEVILNGHPVAGPSKDRAVVFQSPALMPWRTVRSNIAYGLELQGVPRAERERTAQRFIDLVDLGGFEDSYPAELSGGMQQRVNLARALAVETDLLLLDEPLASLDAITREGMQSELLRIWRELGSTAIFITHQINEAVYLADRVIVMTPRPGRIRAEVVVDLPRPRKLADKRSPEFLALETQVWDLLHEDILTAEAV